VIVVVVVVVVVVVMIVGLTVILRLLEYLHLSHKHILKGEDALSGPQDVHTNLLRDANKEEEEEGGGGGGRGG